MVRKQMATLLETPAQSNPSESDDAVNVGEVTVDVLRDALNIVTCVN